ncbi:NAD-dependent succinate-semialdehyde dehydrogenase [Nocardia miyunensis]|uniref:NAD-dependent succinate-semialdehyde dehydrogenase n=1 Tax=Nocardia miyunensis TaxID=282684 RepID=UPI00082A195D|nr:NAD-dependent succinate-semialdehyde dehydrogenase [Nocardia miyunensis]
MSNNAFIADPTMLRIGGRSITTDRTFTVVDPATGASIAEVADATPAHAIEALSVAADVQSDWAATPARARADILRRAWELVMQHSEQFARLITSEMGKPLAESYGEVTYGGEFLRWYAEEAVRINGRYAESPGGAGRILVTRQPVGTTLAITPWNFPLAMGTRKIAPALAAGCTVLIKPAAETPLTMLLLSEVFREAGLPDGVLSILPTSDAAALTAPLLSDSRLRKVTFTGSTAVGRTLLRGAAEHVLRTSMELGGNAPFIVFADADLEAALDGAMAAKMRNGGEACTAANRIYVERSVLDEFTDEFTDRMRALVVGPGDQPGTDLGPMITARQRQRVATLVDMTVAAGARIRTGGTVPEGPGYYYPPTVLTDTPEDALILREEIFGPVATIVAFDGEAAGVAAANNTPYGLAAYIYTGDIDRALRVSAAIEAGMVGVNRGILSDVAAPFGGIKESGLGRESGSEGIDEYLETKYVALR